mgnify:CR=1 FL=1
MEIRQKKDLHIQKIVFDSEIIFIQKSFFFFQLEKKSGTLPSGMNCATLPCGDLHAFDEPPHGKGSADETEGASCKCCVLPDMWLELEPASQ